MKNTKRFLPSKLLSTLVAAAIGGCGGGSDGDVGVLRLPNGQLITVTTEAYANLMPTAGEMPGCQKLHVTATIVSSPGPVPDDLVPTSVSLFIGTQPVWTAVFDPARTQRDSSGELTAVSVDCVGVAINGDVAGALMNSRIKLTFDGGRAEITAPPIPLRVSF